jgi:hypothetical protein
MFGLEKLTAKMIGAGVLILALIGAVMGLINYGQKLGVAQMENIRLEGELAKETNNVLQLKIALEESYDSVDRWREATAEHVRRYDALLNAAPRVVYRDVAATVPAAVPTGDCDIAALGAWSVLRTAGVVP